MIPRAGGNRQPAMRRIGYLLVAAVLLLASFPVVNCNNIFNQNGAVGGGRSSSGSPLMVLEDGLVETDINTKQGTGDANINNNSTDNNTTNAGDGINGEGVTVAPTAFTEAPTTSDDMIGGNNSSSAVIRNVAFVIEYGFYDYATETLPTALAPEQYDGLLAATNSFFTEVLAGAYPEIFSTLTIQMTNQRYDSSSSEPVRVVYNAEMVFIPSGGTPGGAPPSEEEVLITLENAAYQNYLEQYIYVEYPESSTFIFKDTANIGFTPEDDDDDPTTKPTNNTTQAPSTVGTIGPSSSSSPGISPTLAPGQTAPPSTTIGDGAYDDDDATDDSFFGDQCSSQEQLLEACATKNDCLKCEEEIAAAEAANEGGGAFDFGAGDDSSSQQQQQQPPPTTEDFAIVMEQMQAQLNGQCDFFQTTLCQLKTCCPPCSKELDDMYTCFSSSLNNAFTGLASQLDSLVDDALGNLTDLLEDLGNLTADGDGALVGNFTIPPTLPSLPGSILPDFQFNCSFENYQCDAAAIPPTNNQTAPTPAPGTTNKVTVSSAFVLKGVDPNTTLDQPETSALLDKAVADFVQNLQVPPTTSTPTNTRRQRQLGQPKTRHQRQAYKLNRLLQQKITLGKQQQQHQQHQQSRQLASVNADSVQIYNAEPVDCAATLQRKRRLLRYLQEGNNTSGQGDCVKVSFSYDVNLEEGDDPQQVQQQYETATLNAIQSGAMQQSIDSVDGWDSSPQVVGAAEPAPLPETEAPAPAPAPAPTANRDDIEGGDEEDKGDDSGGTNVLGIVLGVIFGLIACILLGVAVVFGGSIWLVCATVCCCCAATKAATNAVAGGAGDGDNKDQGDDGGEDGEKEGAAGDEENPEEQAPADTTFDQQAEEEEEDANDGKGEHKRGLGDESEDDFDEESSAADIKEEDLATAEDPEDDFDVAGSETFDLSKVSDDEPEDPFDDDGGVEGKEKNNAHKEHQEDTPDGLD